MPDRSYFGPRGVIFWNEGEGALLPGAFGIFTKQRRGQCFRIQDIFCRCSEPLPSLLSSLPPSLPSSAPDFAIYKALAGAGMLFCVLAGVGAPRGGDAPPKAPAASKSIALRPIEDDMLGL